MRPTDRSSEQGIVPGMGHKILELGIWFGAFALIVVGASTVLSLGAAKIRNRRPSKYRPKSPHL